MSINSVLETVKTRREIRKETHELKKSINKHKAILSDFVNPDDSKSVVEIGDDNRIIHESLTEVNAVVGQIKTSQETLTTLYAELTAAKTKRRKTLTWFVVIVLIAVGGAGAYFSGVI